MTNSDQLYKIFSLLGTPTIEDQSFVTDDKALEYLSLFKTKQRVDFTERFKGISPHGTDLLDKLLQFNPFFRISLDDAIKHPFFDNVRKSNDFTHQIKGTKVSLDFESQDLNLKQLRALFIEELSNYDQ